MKEFTNTKADVARFILKKFLMSAYNNFPNDKYLPDFYSEVINYNFYFPEIETKISPFVLRIIVLGFIGADIEKKFTEFRNEYDCIHEYIFRLMSKTQRRITYQALKFNIIDQDNYLELFNPDNKYYDIDFRLFTKIGPKHYIKFGGNHGILKISGLIKTNEF